MADKIPNLQLQRWREQHKLTRDQLAQLINQSKSGVAGRLSWPAHTPRSHPRT